jgi:hypothetical protein
MIPYACGGSGAALPVARGERCALAGCWQGENLPYMCLRQTVENGVPTTPLYHFLLTPGCDLREQLLRRSRRLRAATSEGEALDSCQRRYQQPGASDSTGLAEKSQGVRQVWRRLMRSRRGLASKCARCANNASGRDPPPDQRSEVDAETSPPGVDSGPRVALPGARIRFLRKRIRLDDAQGRRSLILHHVAAYS